MVVALVFGGASQGQDHQYPFRAKVLLEGVDAESLSKARVSLAQVFDRKRSAISPRARLFWEWKSEAGVVIQYEEPVPARQEAGVWDTEYKIACEGGSDPCKISQMHVLSGITSDIDHLNSKQAWWQVEFRSADGATIGDLPPNLKVTLSPGHEQLKRSESGQLLTYSTEISIDSFTAFADGFKQVGVRWEEDGQLAQYKIVFTLARLDAPRPGPSSGWTTKEGALSLVPEAGVWEPVHFPLELYRRSSGGEWKRSFFFEWSRVVDAKSTPIEVDVAGEELVVVARGIAVPSRSPSEASYRFRTKIGGVGKQLVLSFSGLSTAMGVQVFDERRAPVADAEVTLILGKHVWRQRTDALGEARMKVPKRIIQDRMGSQVEVVIDAEGFVPHVSKESSEALKGFPVTRLTRAAPRVDAVEPERAVDERPIFLDVQVRDAGTREPIPSATIQASESPFIDSVATAGDGSAVVPVLADRPAELTVEARGYQRHVRAVSSDGRIWIELERNKATNVLDVRVRDSLGGQAIHGATLRVWRDGVQETEPVEVSALGYATIPVFEEKDLRLRVEAPGFEPAERNASPDTTSFSSVVFEMKRSGIGLALALNNAANWRRYTEARNTTVNAVFELLGDQEGPYGTVVLRTFPGSDEESRVSAGEGSFDLGKAEQVLQRFSGATATEGQARPRELRELLADLLARSQDRSRWRWIILLPENPSYYSTSVEAELKPFRDLIDEIRRRHVQLIFIEDAGGVGTGASLYSQLASALGADYHRTTSSSELQKAIRKSLVLEKSDKD